MNVSFDFAALAAALSPRAVSSFLLAAAIGLTGYSANATIKINAVDESRVSNVTGLGSSVFIYGGVAGTSCGTSATSTCSSCTQLGGGDSGLTPCNDRRISGDLVLRITITSDSQATGYPTITYGTNSSGSGTSGQAIPMVVSPTAVSKGNPGTIEVKWGELCRLMTTSSSSGTGSGSTLPTTCEMPSTADVAQAYFNVGMKSVNDNGQFADGDDKTQITIKVVGGPSDTTQYLATTGGNGITYFEVVSGDNKGSIKKLSCTQGKGFPSGQNVRFDWVRVLFEKRSTENTPVWSSINRGSPHTDLSISATGTCDSGLDLSPIAFTSGTAIDGTGKASTVDISNGDPDNNTVNVYDIKLAVVDEARNVYLYTPAANDEDCNNNPNARSGSGYYECHTIRPSVVAGILANKVNCFIATASYGSPMANEVDTFRHFRDTYLIPTKLGLKFVRWYYTNGPAYAHFIAQNENYRAIARGFLWLPLQFAKISLDHGLFAGTLFLLTCVLAPFALLALFARMLQRRRRSRSDA